MKFLLPALLLGAAGLVATALQSLDECDGPAFRNVDGEVCIADFDGPAAALQHAINATPDTRRTTQMPVPIEFPWGEDLTFETGVIVDRPISLRGNGSQVRVGLGQTALTLTPNADRSVVQDLGFYGPETAAAIDAGTDASVGIHIEAHGFFLERVQATRIGVAVEVRSGASADYSGANANFGNVHALYVTRSGTALDLDGPDSNGSLFEQVECQSMRRCIFDSSFLGNVYVAPSSHLSDETAFDFEDLASYPVIIGLYAEGSAPNLRSMGRNGLIVGGTGPNRITEDTRSERVGGSRSRLRFQHRDGRFLRVPEDLEEHIP